LVYKIKKERTQLFLTVKMTCPAALKPTPTAHVA